MHVLGDFDATCIIGRQSAGFSESIGRLCATNSTKPNYVRINLVFRIIDHDSQAVNRLKDRKTGNSESCALIER